MYVGCRAGFSCCMTCNGCVNSTNLNQCQLIFVNTFFFYTGELIVAAYEVGVCIYYFKLFLVIHV